MVKLEDIAKKCGLSVSQVSRALSNNEKVSVNPKTKELVIKVANEMGYVKNIFASNLANKTSNQIAVFVEGVEYDTKDLTNNNVFSLLQGIHEYASKYNLEPNIYIKNKYSNIDYLTFCNQRLISGMIIFGCNYDDENFVKLTNSDFPCVCIDIVNENQIQGCVIVNNTFYAKEATQYLIKSGCKNIAILSGNEHSHVAIERLSGYHMALQANNITINNDLIVDANFDMNTAKQETIKLLKTQKVDGIFCMSDQMAIGCYDAIKSLNLSIPNDIKVFGFDGDIISKYISPPLSTISQNFSKKGYESAKLLTKIIKGENPQRTVVVPCDIIIRESCGL